MSNTGPDVDYMSEVRAHHNPEIPKGFTLFRRKDDQRRVLGAKWHKNGDHPADGVIVGHPINSEGHAVRYYRHPENKGTTACPMCDFRMHVHGWIDQPGGLDAAVCPGNWVITDSDGVRYARTDNQMAVIYDEMHEINVDSDPSIGKGPPPRSVEVPKKYVTFCPVCFATSEDGSAGHIALESGCTNCGNGSTIGMPTWAVTSIREHASWVGKRYYRHEEDRELSKELDSLRNAIGRYPGRTAEQTPHGWVVKQRIPGGSTRSVTFDDSRYPELQDLTADQVIQKTAIVLPVFLELEPKADPRMPPMGRHEPGKVAVEFVKDRQLRDRKPGEQVNHPDHYNDHPSGVECIEIVEHMTFNAGNAIKYLWRAGLKGAGSVIDKMRKRIEDHEKARWYIDHEVERLKKELQATEAKQPGTP